MFVNCKGYMIPGLYFESGYCVWILRWMENPTKSPSLTEVWVFGPDGRRTCYIDPGTEIGFFKKYHAFDEVLGASIDATESKREMSVVVRGNQQIEIKIRTGFSLAYALTNRILSGKHARLGRTETGRATHHTPHRIRRIRDASVRIGGNDLGRLKKLDKDITVGDGKASRIPLVCYCTLGLEE